MVLGRKRAGIGRGYGGEYIGAGGRGSRGVGLWKGFPGGKDFDGLETGRLCGIVEWTRRVWTGAGGSHRADRVRGKCCVADVLSVRMDIPRRGEDGAVMRHRSIIVVHVTSRVVISSFGPEI